MFFVSVKFIAEVEGTDVDVDRAEELTVSEGKPLEEIKTLSFYLVYLLVQSLVLILDSLAWTEADCFLWIIFEFPQQFSTQKNIIFLKHVKFQPKNAHRHQKLDIFFKDDLKPNIYSKITSKFNT